jgi:hypothetical protein
MKRLRALALTAAPHTRLLLFAAVLMSLFAYAGRPLLIAAAAAGAPPALAWSSLFVLAMLPMLAWFGRGRPAAHWIGYATLALFSLLFTLVFLGDVVRLSFRIAGAMLDTRLAAYTILGTAGALSLVGLLQARCPRIRRVAIPIDELPQELDGYRIVQWSDVHVGPTIRRRFLQALVERTNELHPDAIAITGDFVDGSCEEFHSELEPLAAAQARDGIFYVTGNHEYYWHVTDWLTEFERYGLRFLKNSHEVITRGNAKLVMAGVTDPVERDQGPPLAPPANRNRRGPSRRAPPALRPHTRRPVLPVQSGDQVVPADRRRPPPRRQNLALRKPRHRLLGPPHKTLRRRRNHRHRAPPVVVGRGRRERLRRAATGRSACCHRLRGGYRDQHVSK